jgi:hypothetical protein
MILLLFIFCLVLILLGGLFDFIAKKKGYRFQTDKGSRGSSDSELINQVQLNQAIGIGERANP